jgi:uncharacterized protein YjiS (DUF1127 family)
MSTTFRKADLLPQVRRGAAAGGHQHNSWRLGLGKWLSHKRSIYAIVLDALHHSRRLQAERTLRQYRDLIDQAEHRTRTHRRADLRAIADNPHLLADLGITRDEALEKSNTPFWR